MDNQRRDSLVAFAEFRQQLRALASTALEKANPTYVQRFREELERTGDFEEAASTVRHLLGKGIPDWSHLLTLCLDVELALDKTRRALSLLGQPLPNLGTGWNTGAWTIYHLDHWTFEINAWLERLDTLVKRVCRFLLRNRNPSWLEIQERLSGDIQKMKNVVGKSRNPLAHGGGGGVTGPEEDFLWEPSLFLEADEDIVSASYRMFEGQRQGFYHGACREVTALALAASEAIFRELTRYISDTGQKDLTSLNV